MVQSCSASDCKVRRVKGIPMRFFKFPLKNENRLKMWVRATRRADWFPTKHSSLCAKHFQTGQPSLDPLHPDYIPNIFFFTKSGKKTNALTFEDRKKRIQDRERRKIDMTPRFVDGTKYTILRVGDATATVMERTMTYTKEPTLLKNSELPLTDSILRVGDATATVMEVMSSTDPTLFKNAELPLPDTVECSPLKQESSSECSNVVSSFVMNTNTQNISAESLEESEERPTRDELLVEFHRVVKLNYNLTTSISELKDKNEELTKTNLELQNHCAQLERRSLISESLLNSNESLTKSIKKLQQELETCKQKLKSDVFSDTFLDSEEICQFYTPLPNKTAFITIFKEIQEKMSCKRTRILSPEKKLLLVLMKMKLNLELQDLAYRFRVPSAFVGRLLAKWTPNVQSLLTVRSDVCSTDAGDKALI